MSAISGRRIHQGALARSEGGRQKQSVVTAGQEAKETLIGRDTRSTQVEDRIGMKCSIPVNQVAHSQQQYPHCPNAGAQNAALEGKGAGDAEDGHCNRRGIEQIGRLQAKVSK